MRSGLSLNRLLHLTRVLVRHVLAGVLGDRLAGWERLARHLPPPDLPEPERLRLLLEELGGTFIKFGQMLALQPDILPLAYCNALFNLLDRVPPFSFEEVEGVLATELGAASAELFDDFDPRPLAAASIGQVHVAYLDGHKVAVKVQRPSAATDFAGDVRLMKLAMATIRRLRLERLEWLIEPMSEFVDWTAEELDYRREARYMEELRRNGRDSPHQRVPRVFTELTTRRVLVMEFFDGVTVLDYLRACDAGDQVTLRRLALEGFDQVGFAGHVIDNFLHQAFAHGLFHADLHPANLMILPGNVVGYLDFGITGGLSPFARRQMAAMTLAHTRGDLDRLTSALFEVSAMDAGSAAAFRGGLAPLAVDWYEPAGGKLRLRKSFTVVMLELLRLSRSTDVWPDREVIKYFRSSIAIDGLISRFAPGMDLGGYLERACARCIRVLAPGAGSSHNLLEWSARSARLMLDGGLRAAAFVERLADGEVTIRAELGETGGHRTMARQRNAVLLGALVLTLCLLIIAGGERDPGFNLLTAQTLLMAASLWALLGTVRRLARPASPKETSHAQIH